jgi:hypothetical protein
MLKPKIRELIRGLRRPFVLLKRKFFLEEVLVLGDSHADVFSHKKFTDHFQNKFFNVVWVGGATVSGLTNPKSKSQALPIFREYIKKTTAATTIVLLGEVDTGFVIWYRANKYITTVSIMLDMAINNYQNLILEISKKSCVVCISAPLPTIRDENDWGEVADARKEVKATQLERTELTVLFNKRMQGFCEANGFNYLSFDNESIGEDGLIRAELYSADPYDHHYDFEKYADMIIKKLKDFL